MQTAVANPKNHKYSPFDGLPALKQAVADFYKREYDVDLNPDAEIAILGGSKTGLVEFPLTILNPSDTMLLPDPGYPDYLSGVQLAKVKLNLFPLEEANNFLPDYGTINSKVKEDAKLLYLNYPNNPTGAIATSDFFKETVNFAKEN